jgi:hypothetical protein
MHNLVSFFRAQIEVHSSMENAYCHKSAPATHVLET